MAKNGFGRLLFRFYIIYLILIFYGCASEPRFSGKGVLCGLVVDEKNRPVKEAVITCWRGAVCLQSCLTNENGIFNFYDLPPGLYEISGEKNDFSSLHRIKYRFSERGNMFCCQMNSLDWVLECAAEKLRCGQLEEMYKLLDNLTLSKSSYGKTAVSFYKACGKYYEGDKRSAKRYLKKAYDNKELLDEKCLSLFQDMELALLKEENNVQAD
jgi:hypothetical protein